MLTLTCISALGTLIWDNGKIVENLPCAGRPCERTFFWVQTVQVCTPIFTLSSLSTRELEGGYYEMNCTLGISAELLKQSIPYKYVIHTPKTKQNRDDCYEYLHEHHSMNPNRLLRIPKYQQEYRRKFVHCTIKILFSYY